MTSWFAILSYPVSITMPPFQSCPKLRCQIFRSCKTAGFTYRLNVSSIEGDHCNFVAINASNPLEKQFGKSKIIDTLPGYNYTDFEDYLTLPGNVCVVNQQVADKHNLSVGQAVYVHSQNLVEAGQVWSLTSTWINYTIVAIINDLSETIHNVAPPIKPWHLRPLDRAIFISLECADLQFNIMKQNMSYFFIEADSTADIDQLTEHIVSTFNNTDGFSGDGFFGVNLKEMIIEDVKETATLLRIIFIFFSFMSLLVCSILVKNLMEMSLEEQMFEIGILRSMGSSRWMIFKLFSSQVLIISVLGSILGIGFGLLLSSYLINFLSNYIVGIYPDVPPDFHISVHITEIPFVVGFSSGLIIPFMFGLLPAIRAARVEVLKALDPKRDDYIDDSWIRQTRDYVLGTIVGIGFSLLGFLATNSGFKTIFELLEIPDTLTLILTFGGLLSLITGIIVLGATFLPIIANIISYLFYLVFAKVRTITYRNIVRNAKRTKNTFAMLTIGICFLITISVILNSQINGIYPGAQYQIGGDLRVGTIYGEMEAPFYLNSELEQIDGIDTIIPAKMITHGCSIDGYANGLLSPDNRSQFIIFLTNITAYKQMVKQSLIKTEITAPADTSLLQILESMEFGGKIIIQTGLNNFLGKTVGDKVNVSFGSCLEMEIAGVCEMLPGITPMFWSAPKNGYRYIILGSLYDFQKVVLEGYGDTDLILQRRFYNPGNPNPDLGAMNWWAISTNGIIQARLTRFYLPFQELIRQQIEYRHPQAGINQSSNITVRGRISHTKAMYLNLQQMDGNIESTKFTQ